MIKRKWINCLGDELVIHVNRRKLMLTAISAKQTGVLVVSQWFILETEINSAKLIGNFRILREKTEMKNARSRPGRSELTSYWLLTLKSVSERCIFYVIDSNGLPPACSKSTDLFSFSIYILYLFTYSLNHFRSSTVLILLAYYKLRRLTWWGVKALDDEEVRYGDGKEIREKACESGRCVRNGLRKVPTSVISGI